MAYVKVRPPVKIYHLTGKDNLNSILDAVSYTHLRAHET